MIKYNNENYLTVTEILKKILDSNSQIHYFWQKFFPNYQEIMLFDQVKRILYEAKQKNKINIIEYKKKGNGKRKYYAFLESDVIEYIKNRDNQKYFEIKKINKKEI